MATKKTEAEQKPVEKKQKPVEPQAVTEEEERVTILIPYVEGEDREVTVWVNDEVTKIKKGYQVKVKKNVAEVLEHSNQARMVAFENREKLKNQHQDW